jgi:hypothetical protein
VVCLKAREATRIDKTRCIGLSSTIKKGKDVFRRREMPRGIRNENLSLTHGRTQENRPLSSTGIGDSGQTLPERRRSGIFLIASTNPVVELPKPF